MVTLKAIRNVYNAGAIIPAGDVFTVTDDLAADLLNFGKAEPADDATRRRVKSRAMGTWAEGSPESQAQRPWVMRGR